MAQSEERRRTHRVTLEAQVSIHVDGEQFVGAADVRDVSLDAISFKNSKPIQLNADCLFEITITGPSSLLKLSGQGRVARHGDGITAVKFSELDMDSYLHLKNIVLLNRSPEDI